LSAWIIASPLCHCKLVIESSEMIFSRSVQDGKIGGY
jgi:hypothetical protein